MYYLYISALLFDNFLWMKMQVHDRVMNQLYGSNVNTQVVLVNVDLNNVDAPNVLLNQIHTLRLQKKAAHAFQLQAHLQFVTYIVTLRKYYHLKGKVCFLFILHSF